MHITNKKHVDVEVHPFLLLITYKEDGGLVVCGVAWVLDGSC